ncbi:MAG: DinB family protein [Algibacter sp.]
MKTKLDTLLASAERRILQIPETDFLHKRSDIKWSKKEILGHLIDSAINNLQRFTKIQFSKKPFLIIPYDQNELVKSNDYQHAETDKILNLWLSLNYQISHIIKNQTEETLSFKILLKDERESDLRFLITNYVDHLEYHLNQILN